MKNTTKKEYCEKHGGQLEADISATEAAITRESGELEKLNSLLQKCGCCCASVASLKVGWIHFLSGSSGLTASVSSLRFLSDPLTIRFV